MVPVALQEQLEKVYKKGFIIKQSIFSKSLELYPVETWNDKSKSVNNLNKFNRKNVEFIRLFNYGVQGVWLDGSKRIQVPKEQIEFAGIKKEVVLAAAMDMIEIWDKKSYDRFIRENKERFESLTEEVMGSSNS